MATVTGGSGNDTLNGTADADSINGNDGDDLVLSGAGNDSVHGGTGNDTIHGEAGNDTIRGQDGDDRIFGGDGADAIYGGANNDTVQGGTGNDTLFGDAGNDVILGEDGDDRVFGGDGDDNIYGGGQNDTVHGGAGNDTVGGANGNDVLSGGSGVDKLYGGAGDDVIWGGWSPEYAKQTNTAGSQTFTGTNGGTDFTGTVASNETLATGGAGSISGYHVGDNDSNETHTHSYSREVTGGQIRFNALESTETFTLILDGVAVNLNYAIANGDVIFDGGGVFTVDAQGRVTSNSNDPFTVTNTAGALTILVPFTTLAVQAGGTNTGGSAGFYYEVHLDTNPPMSTDGDDIYGEEGNDTIFGADGADTISVDEGSNLIYGGGGDDLISASVENDTMFGGDGNDTIEAWEGSDQVYGGRGNDLLYGGSANDTLYGGEGRDTIYGGIDDDTLDGGDGDDVLDGGAGADLLYGGAGKDSIFGGSGSDFLVGGAGSDLLIGGAGDDTIVGGGGAPSELVGQWRFDDAGDPLDDAAPSDNDAILRNGAAHNPRTGAVDLDGNNDFIEIANAPAYDLTSATVAMGFRLDSLTGTTGLFSKDASGYAVGDVSVWVETGGNIVLRWQTGSTNHFVNTAPGVVQTGVDHVLNVSFDNASNLISIHVDGTLVGSGSAPGATLAGNVNPWVVGARGWSSTRGTTNGIDSEMDGAVTFFEVYEGAFAPSELEDLWGSDTIEGGDGNDALTGGAGADTIHGGAGDDTVYGGTAGDLVDGGDDYDVLDLTGAGPLRVVADPNVAGSGRVEFLDGDRNVVGTMSYQNFEQVIPCFTPGTLIATPEGLVPVECLGVGDLVVTRDSGAQEIRWIGVRHLSASDLARNPALHPVRIRAGALGEAGPTRDLIVSPQHRVLVASARADLMFGTREVLVPARHLAGRPGVETLRDGSVTYIHFLCDRHEIVLSGGLWTESFQPGEQVMNAMDAAARAELLSLFPELAHGPPARAYPAARQTLRAHEARLLF